MAEAPGRPGWLRLNPANDFPNGVYCGSSAVRTDGEFQVGLSGASFRVTSAGVLTAAGTGTFSGQVKAPTFQSTSSIRYKNVERTDDGAAALARVLAIGQHGVRVGRFKTGDAARHRWLLAEDVAMVSPEAVAFDHLGRPDSLSYDELVPDLYAALTYLARRVGVL